MNKNFKKIFASILVACMILTIVPLHATSFFEENGTSSSDSSEYGEENTDILSEINLPSEFDEEVSNDLTFPVSLDDETENENDNWELGLVFYDSTVDNGTTPLTYIDWKTNGYVGYNGSSRTITVQINYKNTNVVTNYQPGELEIKIPNLIYTIYGDDSTSFKAQWDASVILGANDSTHDGYDWTFSTANSPSRSQETFSFKNEKVIEEKTNFEGAIKIVYTIAPDNENPEMEFIEEEGTYKYYDECTHEYSTSLQAELIGIMKSNEISLDYFSEYKHKWNRETYPVYKLAHKIQSLDGLGDDSDDYIWVKYGYYYRNYFARYASTSDYSDIFAHDAFFKDTIPKECKVYDDKFNLLTPDENGTYIIQNDNNQDSYNQGYLFVGYPRSIYNEENGNLIVKNEIELWGTYFDRKDAEKLSTSEIEIDLAEFEFEYHGWLYRVDKTAYNFTTRPDLYYQDIINDTGEDNYATWDIYPTARYSRIPMTIKVGDDLLYSTSSNGKAEPLTDDDYYFTSIHFVPSYFRNGQGSVIKDGKYDMELWVRYANENEFVLLDSFKNQRKDYRFSDSDKKIVQFYFMIYDVKETIEPLEISDKGYGCISATTRFCKKDIPKSGTLYNFDFMQVYFKDLAGNYILQNEAELENYDTFITKEEIASYDLEEYKCYIQRDVATKSWGYFEIPMPSYELGAGKGFVGEIVQDVSKNEFRGTFNIGPTFESYTDPEKKYLNSYDIGYAAKGFRVYDLLPLGMELTSTEDEIANSVEDGYNTFFTLDMEYITSEELLDNLKSEVKITHNWRNTGRTRIEIIGEFIEPLWVKRPGSDFITYSCNYSISYDSMLEHGANWTNYSYADVFSDKELGVSLDSPIEDNGKFDIDAADIDEDGRTDDMLAYSKSSIKLTSVISTHQDATKYVKTDKNYFTTGTAESSLDSEYEYKLRVRTGAADVTNLIIYDSIEEYSQDKNGNLVPAYGTKEHWNGEFLEFDTSFAESQGYLIQPYYSENAKAGNLYDENGNLNQEWKPIKTTNALKIKFNENSKTIGNPDYLRIYFKYNGQNYYIQLYGNNIAGKEVYIPGNDFYLYWYTTNKNVNYYGFSIDSIEPVYQTNFVADGYGSTPSSSNIIELTGEDYPESLHNPYSTAATKTLWHYTGKKQLLDVDKSLFKSLAFEYYDYSGNKAVLPSNSLTYIMLKMKSPSNEDITSFAYNGFRTQWNAIDIEGNVVDFITGINSNIVKVSLPNTIEDDKFVNLNFIKKIDGTDEDFENMKLDKSKDYQFEIILQNNDTGEIITGILDTKEGLIIKGISPGVYTIKESEDNYFNFISINMESMDGILFEKSDDSYMLIIDESVESNINFDISINNEIEKERYYEEKYEKINLFEI